MSQRLHNLIPKLLPRLDAPKKAASCRADRIAPFPGFSALVGSLVAMRRTFATQVHGIGSARDAQTPARHSNATPIMNVSTREIPSNVKDAVEALDQTLLGV